MDKNHILATLKEHAAELKAAGITHLRLFGSVARDESTPHSDIDLMADFDPSRRITLITISGLQRQLAIMLGNKVELSSADWMREPVRARALTEAIDAF